MSAVSAPSSRKASSSERVRLSASKDLRIFAARDPEWEAAVTQTPIGVLISWAMPATSFPMVANFSASTRSRVSLSKSSAMIRALPSAFEICDLNISCME